MSVLTLSILTFGFSTPKKQTIISRLIRLIEGTPYSHTYMQYYDEQLQGCIVYHATAMNVHITPYRAFHEKNQVIEMYNVMVTQEQKQKILKICGEYADTPYGHMQIVGMGLARLMYLWFGIKVKNPFADGTRTQVCSELIGRILRELEYSVDLALLEYEGPKYINKILRLHDERNQ